MQRFVKSNFPLFNIGRPITRSQTFNSFMLAFVVCCACGSTSNAEEYLLRVNTLGYVDELTANKKPIEKFIRSIEVVARPDSAFHCKVKTGTETLVVGGKLRPDVGGGFELRLRYLYSIDTGVSVPTENGGRKPVLDTSSFDTQMTIAVGDGGTLAACHETTEHAADEFERRSRTRYVVLLSEYSPTDDGQAEYDH